MQAFVPHPSFHRIDAASRIMLDPPPIPAPSTAWYFADEMTGKCQPHQILTREQERTLFLQYNFARYRSQHMEPLWAKTAQEKRSLIAAYNIALVVSIVRRKIKCPESWHDDLIAEGNVALLHLIDRFDVRRQYRFVSFAYLSIFRCLVKAVRLKKKEESFATSANPEVVSYDSPQDREEDLALLRSAVHLANLTPREREVIDRRFFLRKTDTLEAIAIDMGVSKNWIWLMQGTALKKIGKVLEEMGNV